MTPNTPSLIAMVTTAVMVDGERRLIQPGEPLPPMTTAQGTELMNAKAATEGQSTPLVDAAKSDSGPTAVDLTQPGEPLPHTTAAQGTELVDATAATEDQSTALGDAAEADAAPPDASADKAPRRKR